MATKTVVVNNNKKKTTRKGLDYLREIYRSKRNFRNCKIASYINKSIKNRQSATINRTRQHINFLSKKFSKLRGKTKTTTQSIANWWLHWRRRSRFTDLMLRLTKYLEPPER